MEPEAPELERIERWMQEIITHPEGVRSGEKSARALAPELSVDASVLPSKSLSAEDRVGIYARMYALRLVEVLASDYPTVQHALGEQRFDSLAAEFLAAHPSRHPNLNVLGKAFPGFLEQRCGDLDHGAFLVDLARLEWSLQEVFDERRAESVTTQELLALPQARWAGARFELVPAARLLAFGYPVDDYVTAFRSEDPPEIPAPRPSWLLVLRVRFRVQRWQLSYTQYLLLRALGEGNTLGEAIERCLELPDVDPEALLQSLSEWFREWAGGGLFRRVQSEEAE